MFSKLLTACLFLSIVYYINSTRSSLDLEHFFEINSEVSPCDDFYEHVCSANNSFYFDLFKKIYWKELDPILDKLIPNFSFMSHTESTKTNLSEEFQSRLQSFSSYWTYIQDMDLLAQQLNVSVFVDYEQFHKIESAEELQKLFELTFSDVQETLSSTWKTYKYQIRRLLEEVLLTTPRYKAAYKNFLKVHENILEFFRNDIKVTPWLMKQNIVDEYINKNIRLIYKMNETKTLEILKEYEHQFTKCLNHSNIATQNLREIACIPSIKFPSGEYPNGIMTPLNAGNEEGKLYVGLGFIESAVSMEDPQTYGLTAATMAHEIAHNYFETSKDTEVFSYFSNDVRECVRDQYVSTHKEYHYDEAPYLDKLLEDSGADNMGNYYAFRAFKQAIGTDNLKNRFILWSNVTNEQAFFYARSRYFCNKVNSYGISHPQNNVRVNALVNMPEFKEAFNCPDDSRMMKTKTKTCYGYGPRAPLTRKI